MDAYEAEQRRLFQQAVDEFRGIKGEIKIEDSSNRQDKVLANV
jgi:hypothetical protein